jgi:hypothetical protein
VRAVATLSPFPTTICLRLPRHFAGPRPCPFSPLPRWWLCLVRSRRVRFWVSLPSCGDSGRASVITSGISSLCITKIRRPMSRVGHFRPFQPFLPAKVTELVVEMK